VLHCLANGLTIGVAAGRGCVADRGWCGVLERAVSIGTGYDARGGNDRVGVGVNWGRAPGKTRDQYTVEVFYRYDMTDFLELTPEIQYVVNPAKDAATDDILVLGFRLRAFF